MTEPRQKDYLTGFYLRDSFYPTLRELMDDHEKNKKHFSMILMDLDSYKKINDKFGHLVGDKALRYVTEDLSLFFDRDKCFRFGGDEFVILVPEKDSEETFMLLTRLKNKMSFSPFLVEGKSYAPINITLSYGVSTFPYDGKTADELVKKSDDAMYLSKHCGRNLITLANRVNHIKFCNTLAIIIVIGTIVFGSTLLYQFYLKKIVHEAIISIRAIRISIKVGLDTIVLKNGGILNGNIVEETKDYVTLSMPLKEGDASLRLMKTEIAKINRHDSNGK